MDEEYLELQPEDYIAGRAIPPDMIRDMLAVSALDARTSQRIVEHLESLKGIAAEESIKEGVMACLPAPAEDEQAGSIVRTLVNLRPTAIGRTLRSVERWRKSTNERQSAFPDELLASLDRNLHILIGDYPSIALLRKANRLLRAVGNEFREVSYFCDMRPVFDLSRKKVEGFVSLANMHLTYIDQSTSQHTFEIALTEDELKELIESSNQALEKLAVLKATSAAIIQGLGQQGQ